MSKASKTAQEVKKDLAKKLPCPIRLASEMKTGAKIRTGIFALDYCLDGGIFVGEGGHRIEFFGKENSGKTTFALLIIKKYQELGKKCLFINAEKSYDVDWAEVLGVKNANLDIAEPDSLEQAGNLLADAMGQYDLIVMDSIPALVTQEELEGGLEDQHMASQAKVYSPMMRKLYGATKELCTTIIFLNQLREKVGVMYGKKEDTPGGRALKHFYNTQIEFKPGANITKGTDDDKEIIGREVLLNCTKNKRGKPHRNTALDFYLNGLIDNRKSLFYAGIKYNLIERKGNTYTYKDCSAVGQEKFMDVLTDKVLKDLENDVWKLLK